MRHTLSLASILLAAATGASARSPQELEQVPQAELVLSGPAEMPLLWKGRQVTFTAALINRTDAPVAFVPPHKEWYDERHLEWQATDSRGRPVDRAPFSDMVIECDVHGVMSARPIFDPPPLNAQPRRIHDSDLVILQPGEKYEIGGLVYPTFALNFLKRGAYRVTLAFDFDPAHYRLAPGSKKTGALQKAASFFVVSNELTVTIN